MNARFNLLSPTRLLLALFSPRRENFAWSMLRRALLPRHLLARDFVFLAAVTMAICAEGIDKLIGKRELFLLFSPILTAGAAWWFYIPVFSLLKRLRNSGIDELILLSDSRREIASTLLRLAVASAIWSGVPYLIVWAIFIQNHLPLRSDSIFALAYMAGGFVWSWNLFWTKCIGRSFGLTRIAAILFTVLVAGFVAIVLTRTNLFWLRRTFAVLFISGDLLVFAAVVSAWRQVRRKGWAALRAEP